MSSRGIVKQEKEMEVEEKDMTHYINDRVELMRQVFSVLKERELKAMAPTSLRTLPVDHLQELCLDEVLGISTKRLCSILDGFDCPTDTDSDCPDNIETLSLDSISSLEDDLQANNTKRKKKEIHHKKHRHRDRIANRKLNQDGESNVSNAPKRKKKKRENVSVEVEGSSTAGMTVLELLELQMRAKAIRAQLQTVTQSDVSDEDETKRGKDNSKVQNKSEEEEDNDEIEIKEEKPEVVEIITSDEENTIIKAEKSDILDSMLKHNDKTSKTLTVDSNETSSKHSLVGRKIKLNRSRQVVVSVSEEQNKHHKDIQSDANLPSNDLRNLLKRKKNNNAVTGDVAKEDNSSPLLDNANSDEVSNSSRDTKQPIDTETKNTETEKSKKRHYRKTEKKKKKERDLKRKVCDEDEIVLELSDTEKMFDSESSSDESSNTEEELENENKQISKGNTSNQGTNVNNNNPNVENEKNVISSSRNSPKGIEAEQEPTQSALVCDENISEKNDSMENREITDDKEDMEKDLKEDNSELEVSTNIVEQNVVREEGCLGNVTSLKTIKSRLSEGECSESSNDIEIMNEEMRKEIVCLSDEEDVCSKEMNKEEYCDKATEASKDDIEEECSPQGNELEDTVLEILDDSSRDSDVCVLSKEPSRQEILQLSRKLEEEMEMELAAQDQTTENNEENTWKERWLGSDKVQNVLKTSSLFNAIRKKNMELKRKLKAMNVSEETERNEVNKETERNEVNNETAEKEMEESKCEENADINSVEFYKSLPSGSKEYSTCKPMEETKKMAKDARQLMKMYKKLLKMNKELGGKKPKVRREGKKKDKKK